jgi:outer membrane protein TolC
LTTRQSRRNGWPTRHAWLLALCITATAGADEPGLPLDEAVRATLRHSPEIRLAEQDAETARGTLLASGAPFDLNLTSSLTGAREHASDPAGADAIRKRVAQSLGLQRLFRNGISLRPDVTFTRSGFDTFPGSATRNDASVGLTAALPLWRDRGGTASAAGERAARHDYAASRFTLRHTIAARVLAAVTAYWDYVSAEGRLAVFADSEKLAERTTDRTRVLVEADERTAADLTQVRANLASKRVTRLAAEQALTEAQQQLGLAIGLPAERIATLPRASTAFPAPGQPTGERAPAEPPAGAGARRDDLAAAEQAQRAADSVLAGVRSELRPRLDLSLTAGYNAAQTGLGFTDFFAPAWRDAARVDTSVQLAFQFPTANSRARGRLLQSASAAEQQRILTDDLRRRVASGVVVAAQALARAASGVRESELAVRLSEETVQAEARKFDLGVSTLFDVIQAEDSLTSARLGRIQSQRNYAVAIASLRFQSGVLVAGEPEQEARVPLEHLLTPP